MPRLTEFALSRREFLLTPAALASASSSVRFGVIADVQYADKDRAGRRDYRASYNKLQVAADMLASERVGFTVHLGDLVDSGEPNFDRIAPVFDRLPGPRYHVLGNHDWFASREHVLRRFGLRRGYYEFRKRGWRFLVLNGMEVSAMDPEGARMLEALRQKRVRNAQTWNGALGEEQRGWLSEALDSARRHRERAIVFCHFPVVADASRPEHLLWDHAEVLAILESHSATAAYFSGHDHNGGRAFRNGIHHVTLRGIVENDVKECVLVVEASPDRIILRTAGRSDAVELALKSV